MKITWVVVADGAKAQIYKYQGPNQPLTPLRNGKLTHINKPSRELVSSNRGRTFNSVGKRRAALEFGTDPHEYEKTIFAKRMADFLKVHAGNVNRIIIAAPPKVLGDLRQKLPNNIKGKVSNELSKNLTNIPSDELTFHLRDTLNLNSSIRSHLLFP